MLFIGSAQLNRSQPNGFIPNGHGFQVIASDDSTSTDVAVAFQQDYHLFLADAVSAVTVAANTHGIVVGDTVRMTDWVKARITDPLSDFE